MSRRRTSWAAFGALLGVLMCAFGSTMATTLVTNDVTSASLASWRIAQTGTPWLEDIDWQSYEQQSALWVAEAENGHEVAFRSPGPVAAGVPAYAVARLVGADDYSMIPGSVTAALLTTLAMLLLYGALRPRAGTRLALGATLAVGLTTPVWTVSADSLWTHPVTLLGIAGMAYATVRERWWLVGLFGGVALWGRLHTAVIVAVLGLVLSWIRRDPRICLLVGSVSSAFLGLSLVWGHWMYGSWSPAGGYSVDSYAERALTTTDLSDQLVNHLGLWIAPDRGILVWTPVLLLLLPALLRGWRTLPDWSRVLLGAGLVYTLIQGQLNGFSGGSNFYGYRLTLELLLCVAPAFALSVPHAGRLARRLLGPVLGIQFAAFSLGSTGDGGLLPENKAWIANSFTHVLAEQPGLWMWPLLMAIIGYVVGRAVEHRILSAPQDATPPHRAGEARPADRSSPSQDRFSGHENVRDSLTP